MHKETLAVAVAGAGREAPESRGEIASKPKTVAKLVERLNQEFGGEVLLFCYEAGPCGYGLYRQLPALGHDCQVLGDISRFDSPRQLMAYLSLVPSEHSSGRRRRQGAITKTGNSHTRRMPVESAWSYRFPTRQTMHLKRKAQQASEAAKVIAWRAQKRLCGRYRTLLQAGKNTKQTTVAIAPILQEVYTTAAISRPGRYRSTRHGNRYASPRP